MSWDEIAAWKPSQVLEWVEENVEDGSGAIGKAFTFMSVDGETFLTLTDDELEHDLKVKDSSERDAILGFLHEAQDARVRAARERRARQKAAKVKAALGKWGERSSLENKAARRIARKCLVQWLRVAKVLAARRRYAETKEASDMHSFESRTVEFLSNLEFTMDPPLDVAAPFEEEEEEEEEGEEEVEKDDCLITEFKTAKQDLRAARAMVRNLFQEMMAEEDAGERARLRTLMEEQKRTVVGLQKNFNQIQQQLWSHSLERLGLGSLDAWEDPYDYGIDDVDVGSGGAEGDGGEEEEEEEQEDGDGDDGDGDDGDDDDDDDDGDDDDNEEEEEEDEEDEDEEPSSSSSTPSTSKQKEQDLSTLLTIKAPPKKASRKAGSIHSSRGVSMQQHFVMQQMRR